MAPAPVFLTYNVRMKNSLWCTFSSRRVTLGNHNHAFQAPLWHSSLFLTYNVRMKIGLPRTFSSGRVTSGTAQRAFLCSKDCYSKSFGESTPHREAYRAHSSTPSRRPCKAHRSPNDLEQGFQMPLVHSEMQIPLDYQSLTQNLCPHRFTHKSKTSRTFASSKTIRFRTSLSLDYENFY